jgi:hypothetical protein
MKRACRHSLTRMCCLHDDPWPRASDREKGSFPADNTPLFLPLSSPHAEATPRAGLLRAGESGEVTPPVHFFVSFRFRPDSIKIKRARERHSLLRLPIIGLCTLSVGRGVWWRREPVRDLREGELCSVARLSHPYLSTHHCKVASLRNKTAPNCTGVCGQKKSKAKSLGRSDTREYRPCRQHLALARRGVLYSPGNDRC